MSDEEKAALLRELRSEAAARQRNELDAMAAKIADLERHGEDMAVRIRELERQAAVSALTQRLVHFLIVGLLGTVLTAVGAVILPK